MRRDFTKGPAEGQRGGPRQQFCGDMDIRIAADGRWYYQGSPIGRQELVSLFASVLYRDAAGDYWLETPVEKARIQVDDAPFLAVEMFCSCCGETQTLSFRTNIDEVVSLDAEHPLRVAIDPETGEPSPYVMVRDGLEARLTRAVYYELVNHGVFADDAPEPPAGCACEVGPAGIATDDDNDDLQTGVFGVWSGGHFFPMGRLASGEA